MEEVRMKNISSLEKRFASEKIDDVKEYDRASALKGERFTYQIAYVCEDIRGDVKRMLWYRLNSPLSDHITVSRVDTVPVRMPMYKIEADDYFISRKPGL